MRKGPATKVAGMVPRGIEGRNQWYIGTSERHYKRKKQPTLEGHLVRANQNRIIEKTLSKTQRK